MSELNDALAQISTVRSQLARVTRFHGYGPASIAAGGLLALVAAGLEARLANQSQVGLWPFIGTWTLIAVLAISFAVMEIVRRTKRAHSSLAIEMMQAAATQFLPAIGAGLLFTVVLVHVSPDDGWMLPGLWQIFFALGIFASCHILPRATFAAGAWYMIAGLACLMIGGRTHALSPWEMGIPFGIGQCLVATILRIGDNEES
ncbi:MAG TPA: hypothetical protein VK437_13425 [Steroidobacteraceae bacterium]|nr:hypothetical protein [Steroidobacteraceae bacterium]